MNRNFLKHPILNSPYKCPQKHWELRDRLPTNNIIGTRRPSDRLTPVPKPKKLRKGQQDNQTSMALTEEARVSSEDPESHPNHIINTLRKHVEEWRSEKNPERWYVTPETARLLKHWRNHKFQADQPFFCQVEAVETIIWLTEVAPKREKWKKEFWGYIENGSKEYNPELQRLALKLATGAGKTIVMAMLIAWQTVNANRHPNSKQFSRGFLIVTPGITIRDRLRVLLPNDPENYYHGRELIPTDMWNDIKRAEIVITNYHALQRRERFSVSKGTRAALKGRHEETLQTKETEGQMLQRVMPQLMGMKKIIVLNDEAHHCYREKAQGVAEGDRESDLKGDEKKEAETNNEAARVWLSGLETVNRKMGISYVYDLSATPFFLRGSGHGEGKLFPWTVSDFSLMDAIECGIVKLPRVPVSDDSTTKDKMPVLRNLWEHIGKELSKNIASDKSLSSNLPTELESAISLLYGNYVRVFKRWEEANISVPPVFIVVCNNTTTSKRVYKYISGFWRESEDGSKIQEEPGLELFRNYDAEGNHLTLPKTILIDSAQLESGEALDRNFRQAASDEIDRFRAEILERTGDKNAANNIDDAKLLREVTNTVGKEGKLGEQIRCVVSVSMLTEGWDANTVTHILGVRAFGTQLLCEQVVGRALRRLSYITNEEGLFDPEYADVLGIPFDFTDTEPPPPNGPPPEPPTRVHAVSPERDHLEIIFPRVQSYYKEFLEDRLEAEFKDDHVLSLSELVEPTETEMIGIVGEGETLSPDHLKAVRSGEILYNLTKHLLKEFPDANGEPKTYMFGQLKRITSQWLKGGYLDGEYPALVLYPSIKNKAVKRIVTAIKKQPGGEPLFRVLVDPYNPVGSTKNVDFKTTKKLLWQADANKCHINLVVLDNDWEGEFCRVVEKHPRVLSYVKNQGLGFKVPYMFESEVRDYYPDYIVQVNVGEQQELFNLIVEIKGYRRENAKQKALTVQNYWVPGVNRMEKYGRWGFLELKDKHKMKFQFEEFINNILEQERKVA